MITYQILLQEPIHELSALNSFILYCGMSWKYVKCYNEVNAFSDWRENFSLTPIKYKLCRIQRLTDNGYSAEGQALQNSKVHYGYTMLKYNHRQN
jgi:hypothetical protein